MVRQAIFSAGSCSFGMSVAVLIAVSAATAEVEFQGVSLFTNTQRQPAISGDWVVWQETGFGPPDIYAYNVETESHVGLSVSQDYTNKYPAIDGDLVVWVDSRNGSRDLYGMRLSDPGAAFPVPENQPVGYMERPDVSGERVAWQHSAANGYIAVYDNTTNQTTMVDTDSGQYQPAIYGDIVVWADSRNDGWTVNGNLDVYGYNLATGVEFPIANAPNRQRYPEIHGNIVVWEDSRSGEGDIYGYDLSTGEEFLICDAPGWQLTPVVSDRYVVWEDHRSATEEEYGSGQLVNADVYGYDLLTGEEFAVFVGEGFQGAPDISGNRAVWVDASGYVVEPPPELFDVNAYAAGGLSGGDEGALAYNSTTASGADVGGYTMVGTINRPIPEPATFLAALAGMAGIALRRQPRALSSTEGQTRGNSDLR